MIKPMTSVIGDSAQHKLDAEGIDPLLFTGVNDSNLHRISSLFKVQLALRGDQLVISGKLSAVEDAIPLLEHLLELARLRKSFTAGDIPRLAEDLLANGVASQDSVMNERRIALPGSGKIIRPKSRGQEKYLEAILNSDVVVGIGPAGTGKTYLAVASAVDCLYKKRVERIILARPAVEAGESLGFLPGDLQDKVDPYLRPLYDALEDMMPSERVRRAIQDRVIEIAPLAYMRGRTLSDAFVILDEAQNSTKAQMKMFLTRLGLNSQVVITGDKTQIDLSNKDQSGLIQIESVLRDIEGIEMVYLNEADVIRHRLVKDIIGAYEKIDSKVETEKS